MNLDRGGRVPSPPPSSGGRNPFGRTCGGLLLLMPLWPVLIAAHALRRWWSR